MIQTFKKGQIVPRRLRLAMCIDKKSQHSLVFGCDVVVKGRNIYGKSDGPLIRYKQKGRRMNNGTFRKNFMSMDKVYVWPYGCGCENVEGIPSKAS